MHADEWPAEDEHGFRFPVIGANITNVRQLTHADLDTLDLRRLVIMSQDHWHFIDRSKKLVSKSSPDHHSFSADLSRIVSAGSCRYNPPFAATTPAALQTEALTVALHIRHSLLELIPKYSQQQSRQTAEERMDASVRMLGAALLEEEGASRPAGPLPRGPDTAPAALREYGLSRVHQDVEVFRNRSLASANAFESISADIVRLSCSSPSPRTCSSTCTYTCRPNQAFFIKRA